MILQDELDFLDHEINDAKLRINGRGFHNGTALSIIVRRYRDELKEYRSVVRMNKEDIQEWPTNENSN